MPNQTDSQTEIVPAEERSDQTGGTIMLFVLFILGLAVLVPQKISFELASTAGLVIAGVLSLVMLLLSAGFSIAYLKRPAGEDKERMRKARYFSLGSFFGTMTCAALCTLIRYFNTGATFPAGFGLGVAFSGMVVSVWMFLSNCGSRKKEGLLKNGIGAGVSVFLLLIIMTILALLKPPH